MSVLDLERWQRLRAAAADAEHDGPSFADVQEANGRWARVRDELARFKIEAELRSAETLYRSHGLLVAAPHPAAQAHLRQQAVIGMCMVVGADKLLRAERARIEAQGEGLTALDKAGRLNDLHRQILRAAARKELALRQIESAGEFLPRPVHVELAVFQRSEVERLAR